MKLFEPGKIGEMSLKNRVVMTAMFTGLVEPDGRLSQRGIDYYVARARGGVGLIVTSSIAVCRDIEQTVNPQHMHHFSIDNRLLADNRLYLGCYNELADAVHDYGVKIAAQLSAGMGRVVLSGFLERGGRAVAPSSQPCFSYPTVMAHELTLDEIERLINAYEFSARLMSDAGVDAIEIHGHMGYLIDEFATALWNKRTDKYGGNLENRLRFPMELIKAARRGAGPDFPIIYRYGLSHYHPGGREITEGLEMARRLEDAGVDAIDIDAGCYETYDWAIPPTTRPSGLWVDLAEKVKSAVKIPVIVAGKLGDSKLAEQVLQDGKADFIGLARPLLADPDWVNKIREGREDDIRPCIGDHEGCRGMRYKRNIIGCTVNPVMGLERELELKLAENRKSVVVVGGGPGGMEAAKTAALRGHQVTLLEKCSTLGGNLIPAAVPDFKFEYRKLLDYFSTQIKKTGVTIRLNEEADEGLILDMNPDVVFIATGGTPTLPGIPGVEKEKVVMAVDLLLGKKEAEKSVAVIGGGFVGCETALYLAQKGRNVTIVEVLDGILKDVQWMNRTHLMQLLGEVKVTTLTKTTALEITDEGMLVATKSGEAQVVPAETVVLAVGMRPNNGLYEALKDIVQEIYSIGDCVEPRKVINAVWEGFRKARLI